MSIPVIETERLILAGHKIYELQYLFLGRTGA